MAILSPTINSLSQNFGKMIENFPKRPNVRYAFQKRIGRNLTKIFRMNTSKRIAIVKLMSSKINGTNGYRTNE